MTLSAAINMLKLLVDRHSVKKKQMADYLDAIAEDASKLAEQWRTRFEDLVRRFEASGEEGQRGNALFLYECAGYSQSVSYHSMVMYYEKFNEVFDRKKDNLLEEFRESLIKIVSARKIAKKSADSQLQLLSVPADAKVTPCGEDFRNAVLEIHQHAAALKVLAKTFRVSL